MAESKDATALESLRSDDFYHDFFQDDFDASRYANSIIQGTTIALCLQKLSEGIAQLESELHTQVSTNHRDLIVQATSMDKLEAVLQVITTRVDALQKSAERIREKVDKPYHKLVQRTQQLARLQSACEILRRTTRFLYLSGRLREQARGGTREITKMAYTLSELKSLEEEVDLGGVDVVDGEQQKIREVRETVERNAALMLAAGLEASSQAQTATALQVFRNLDQLGTRVDECLADRMQSVATAVGEALSGELVEDRGTRTANLRALLWTRVDKMFSSLALVISQVLHLQRTLAKKRDTGTQARFCDIIQRPDVAARFVAEAFARIADRLQHVAKEQPSVRKAFEAEYPKLLRPAVEFWGRVVAAAGADLSDRQQRDGLQAVRASVGAFETAYLGACLSRLFDPVNLMFPQQGGVPPSPEDITNLARTMSKELDLGCIEASLAIAVARNVAKTIQLFAVRAEALRSTSSDALILGRGCTEEMALNIGLANRLDQFHACVEELPSGLPRLPPAAAAILTEAVKAIENLVDDIIETLFEAAARHLESTLLSMHADNYNGGSVHADPREEPDQPCSAYVMVLQGQIASLEADVLDRFSLRTQIPPRVRRLLQRLLLSFVRHCSLLSSLTEAGKLRLAADMAQIELALAQLQRAGSVRLADLGPPYHALRSFRPLLFMELDAVPSNPALGGGISYSTVLHHLFSRSPTIKPPHACKGWTVDQYASWLAQHSEGEALEMVAMALDAYLATVKARGEAKFAPAYPVMRALLHVAQTPGSSTKGVA